MEEGGRRRYVAPSSVAGSRATAPWLHCVCDYACSSRLSGSRFCDCAATELYLEIPVINEAGATFCMEEVDEE